MPRKPTKPRRKKLQKRKTPPSAPEKGTVVGFPEKKAGAAESTVLSDESNPFLEGGPQPDPIELIEASARSLVEGEISHEMAQQAVFTASCVRRWIVEGDVSDPASWFTSGGLEEDPLQVSELFDREFEHADAKRRAAAFGVRAVLAAPEETEELANAALSADAQCADAWTARALIVESAQKRLKMLRKAQAMAEEALGRRRLRQVRNAPWLETDYHPYLRARYYQAQTLFVLGQYPDALNGFRSLFDDCKVDFLVSRQYLMPLYLMADEVEAADDLLASFPDDTGPVFTWAAPLIQWALREFEGANDELHVARMAWPLTEDYITGRRTHENFPHEHESDEEMEAAEAGLFLSPAWRCRPLALHWLQTGGQPGDGKYLGMLDAVGFFSSITGSGVFESTH